MSEGGGPLRFLVFLGSVRASAPPHPPRLGLRVARACLAWLNQDSTQAGLVDPLDIELPPVFKPHFATLSGAAPAGLEGLARQITAADGYVMVSPEYNHSMSPALAHLLNHFGSSLFAFKPSVIVTYSAGQWGGTRAAVGMRSFLGELGCLPVSAMVHVPRAQDVFAEDGSVTDQGQTAEWAGYFGRAFRQLDWWAAAARAGREARDPHALTPAFRRSVAARNAPGDGEG